MASQTDNSSIWSVPRLDIQKLWIFLQIFSPHLPKFQIGVQSLELLVLSGLLNQFKLKPVTFASPARPVRPEFELGRPAGMEPDSCESINGGGS
jgi:hypothetical protein